MSEMAQAPFGQIAISNQPSFHIPISSVTAFIPNTLISWSTRSVPKLSIKISKPIQVMRTMVVYLLGTSGQPLDSIQPVQENQSMIWASLSLKKSFSIFPSKSSKFAPTHTLQAPISSKSPIRWQEKQEVSHQDLLEPNCSSLTFHGSPHA